MPADRGPTILLLGRDGQLGWELHRTLAPLARIIAPLVGTYYQAPSPGAERRREGTSNDLERSVSMDR